MVADASHRMQGKRIRINPDCGRRKLARMGGAYRRLSILGSEGLSVPVALCFAHRGFPVVLVGPGGGSPAGIQEPYVADLWEGCREWLTVTPDAQRAVSESDATILVTASGEDVGSLCWEVGRALRTKKGYHLVVLMGLGTWEISGRVLLEHLSGRRIGEGFGLAWTPGWPAPGRVLADLFRPQSVRIVESDPAAGDRLEALCRELWEGDPAVLRTPIGGLENSGGVHDPAGSCTSAAAV